MIYFCPTPIGNLGDITLRTIEILESVDIVFAEDKRNSIKLLNHYNISTKLSSYHKFNEKAMAQQIIEIAPHNDIAIISDAGMPGISDPGVILIKELIDKKIDFRVLPGANAAITALILSGLDTDHFLFYGFCSSKSSARKKELDNLKNLEYTLIFYEAPHRIKGFLLDLFKCFGRRRISISREITKVFEETIRTNTEDVINMELVEKGEFVVVVEANTEIIDYDIKSLILNEMSKGLSKSKAVKEVSKNFNLPKNEVYKESLDL